MRKLEQRDCLKLGDPFVPGRPGVDLYDNVTERVFNAWVT